MDFLLLSRFSRKLGNLGMKPVFQAGDVDWPSEFPSIPKHHNDTPQHSIKNPCPSFFEKEWTSGN